ncbi:hypothetical protein QEZ54_07975 [Catellatospora sp. KI3]|uniref:hypothetical protein n=1 Tax=Catellatospora sp. KI3 TaxID=3041620 RepID=UPI002482B6FD|nr:hypothetical protein [Catellatospora sp. KI3]MDI1460899.1 hypothetical protein [Catellatospora sp. KI3]
MNLQLRVYLTVVALATALVPLGAASPAAADPAGLVIVKETSNPTSGQSKHTDVVCPAGTAVAGGGGYLTAPAPTGYAGLIRMQPIGESQFWVATQEAVAYGPNWTHTTVAICVPKPAGWEIVSSVGGNQEQYVVTPSCGPGRSVIGAGGRINGGVPDVVLEDVVPSADLKTVTVRGVEVPESVDDTWSVTAYAVCADTPAGLQRVSFPSASSSDSRQTATGLCPAGKALLGTGVEVNAGNGHVLLSGINTVGVDRVSTWADEIVGGYSGNWSITAYGICAS